MRIFAVSDLHADYPENLQWIHDLPQDEFARDILILAGDVTDDLNLLAGVFESLKLRFRDVLFVPGNHELWVERDGIDCSIEKFNAVTELCHRLEVRCEVSHYGELTIVPLYSWYDFSFGEPDRHLRRAWRDFRACRWPQHLSDASKISQYFLQKNEPYLNTMNERLISFSHFVPRIDVMPAAIPEPRRRVYPVLGSDSLGEQVRRLNPDIHVYGHSHVNRSVTLDEVCYVNNAFAYPKEEHIARKQLHCILELVD